MKRDRRSQELREAHPEAAKVFDYVLNKYKRKSRPWMPFYGFEKSGIVWNLTKDDKEAYRVLMLRFRHREFDKLRHHITQEENAYFDAWGPMHLPTYRAFYDGLSTIEQHEFTDYRSLRRAYTIDIETPYKSGELSYEHLEDLLHKSAEDERAQFRYLASIVEYGDNDILNNFSEAQFKQILRLYEAKRKRLEEILGLQTLVDYSSPTPLQWMGTKAELVAVMDSLVKAGLLKAQDKEIIHHFDFATKYESKTPYKRFSGTRSELKKGESYADKERFNTLIQELQSYLT